MGLRELFQQVRELRAVLADDVYVWINSFKREPNYFSEQDVEFLQAIDPYFQLNRHFYSTLGKPCQTGNNSFTVDGRGDVQRCHFIDTKIGNLYQEDIFSLLSPSGCTNETCGCHIGYVYLEERELDRLFGANMLERIPAAWPEIDYRMPPWVRIGAM